jgi:hypothetical protein
MTSGVEKDIHIREVDPASSLTDTTRVKPVPKSGKIPVPFDYTPSDDGTNENLLILLHGLGAPLIVLSFEDLLSSYCFFRRYAHSVCETWKTAQVAANSDACPSCT